MAEQRIEITEQDDAGNITATYIHSATDQPGVGRVDVIDSLQAFSSSIAGLLSSRAVLSSVGVGDSTASPTAALLLTILQESAGRVATILFAHRFGTTLEPECKMYRLLADILNDLAFILDCLSPAFPKPARVVVLSFSSMLRALCGVAAGSAKASLSAHFARWGNLGELNAKDSSQETVISLLGMLAGSLVVSWVTDPMTTWITLLALLAIHLETNRRAVRAVSMRSLNRQRATLVFHALLRRGKKGDGKADFVPTPEHISSMERIFERDGVLRDEHDNVLGHCIVGADLSTLLTALKSQSSPSSSSTRGNPPKITSKLLEDVLDLYREKKYILWPTHLNNNGSKKNSPQQKPRRRKTQLIIILKTGATNRDVLLAWWHALALVTHPNFPGGDSVQDDSSSYNNSKPTTVTRQQHPSEEKEKQEDKHQSPMKLWHETFHIAENLLLKNEENLRRSGWDLETAALETRMSSRVTTTMGLEPKS